MLIYNDRMPIGFSDLLPEGICGVLPGFTPPTPKTCAIGSVLAYHKTYKKPKPKPKPKKGKTDKPGTTYKRPKKLKPRLPPKPEQIRSRASGLEIDYEKLTVPDYLKNMELLNVVEVPEELLHSISRVTDDRTKKLGKLLLKNVAPSILAYAASINYVSTVMQDSFGIDFDEDTSIREAVKDITKIEVLEFFTKRLKVPPHRKEHIMSALVEKLTTKTVDRMERESAREAQDQRIKSLEAVLQRRSPDAEGVVLRGEQVKDGESGVRIYERPMIKPEKKRRGGMNV